MSGTPSLNGFTPLEHADLTRLHAAWRQRDELPAYRPAVPDDVDEPWGLCLHDLAPAPPALRPAIDRKRKTRAGRRSIGQRLRALLPRLDVRGITDGLLP